MAAEDEALAAFGYHVEREPEAPDLMPADILPAVAVFETAARSQWVTAPMGGVTGLRYEALPMVMDAHGIPATDRLAVLDDLAVMERRGVQILNSSTSAA